MGRAGQRPALTRRPCAGPATRRSRCADRWPSPCRARSARGPMPTRGSAGCRRRTSLPRPSSSPPTASRHRRASSTPWSGRAPLIESTIGSDARVPARLPALRPALAAGRARPQRGAGVDPRGHRDGRVRGVRPWRPRLAPGTRAGCRRLPDHGRRPARPRLDLDRSDRRRLSRRPGHDPSAQQLRDRRPRDPGHPRPARATRPGRVRPGRGDRRRLDPRRDRGGQAGHGRSRRASDRPGQPRHPGRAPARSGPTRPSWPRGSTRAAPPARPVPRTRRVAARSTSRSSTVTATRSASSSRCTGRSDRASSTRTRACSTRTGAATSASTRAPECPRARQAHPPHAAPRDAVP